MSFATLCPHCGARRAVPDAARGTTIRCEACGASFVARAARGRGDPPRRRLPIGVVILAAVLLGGTFVLAAGFGVYVLLNPYGKPVDRPVPAGDPAPPARVPAGGPEPGPADWVRVHEPAGRYHVQFPDNPQTRVQPHRGANGEDFDMVVHVWETDAESLLAAHKPVPDTHGRFTTDYVLDQGFSNQRLRPKGGTERSRKPIEYRGYPGRELILDFPDKGLPGVGRLILAGDRIILLVASGPGVGPDSARARQFFDSLEIDDPQAPVPGPDR